MNTEVKGLKAEESNFCNNSLNRITIIKKNGPFSPGITIRLNKYKAGYKVPLRDFPFERFVLFYLGSVSG